MKVYYVAEPNWDGDIGYSIWSSEELANREVERLKKSSEPAFCDIREVEMDTPDGCFTGPELGEQA